MILVSRKVDYGILALHHLMLNTDGASARELADQYNLSRAFVANILKELCQANFLVSHRGVHGGYRLAREPKAISLESVITALDGPFQLMSCSNSESSEADCGLVGVCPVKGPLRVVHERFRSMLASVTLEDLRNEPPALVNLHMEEKPSGCSADLP